MEKTLNPAQESKAEGKKVSEFIPALAVDSLVPNVVREASFGARPPCLGEQVDPTAKKEASSLAKPADAAEGERVQQRIRKKEDLLLSEKTLHTVTVQSYYDDPVLPYRLREVIMKPKNKSLLVLYEASLPSWCVVMATYGYYKPWFRFWMRYFMIFVSITAMLMGFYDLYKNVPILRQFLSK